MKNSTLRTIIIAIGLVLATCVAKAELMVGDKAPKLQTGKWIQGAPVTAFDTNHIYIVEFWATWCGPCIGSIPHLNALWEKYKDKGVIVIGQDVWDSDDAVAPFVKKMGTNMTYRVALDDKSQIEDGFMDKNWWPRKINHHGIPTAFIINKDGMIAWIGHPMTLNEGILDEIVSGHQDLAKATTDYRKDFETDQKFQDAQSRLRAATRAKKWDDAQTILKEIDNMFPNWAGDFVIDHLQVLLGQKKFDKAFKLADSISKQHLKSDGWQNSLAWTIAVSDNPDEQCLGLAETIAERSVELTQGTNSAPLDTLARVQFMLGKKSEAIATEEKAADIETDLREKNSLEKTLASYREGKLPDAKE